MRLSSQSGKNIILKEVIYVVVVVVDAPSGETRDQGKKQKHKNISLGFLMQI